MKRIAIYANSSRGHFLEYLNNIYNRCYASDYNEYYFIVPYDFPEVKDELIWKNCEHIHFIIMTEEESIKHGKLPVFFSSFFKAKVLRKYILQYKIDSLFAIMLVHILPFIVLFAPKETKISGILYQIYYYGWKNNSLFRKIHETLQYLLLSKNKKFKSILILNDLSGTAFLNKKFTTNKFKFINDPLSIHTSKFFDIRGLYGISEKQKLFLHFGGLTERKGTLIILEMLKFLTDEEKHQYVFMFAGKVAGDINECFYNLVDKYTKEGVKIIIKDEFCPYSFIENSCKACNCILIPYTNVIQSSGVIGYAAYFDKPVIGPRLGLLGKLIRRYKLGISTNVNAESIYDAVHKLNLNMPNISIYKDMLSIYRFLDTIEKSF